MCGLLQGNEKMCSEAYDAFFQRYPYCYGYWKKYSDMFKKHGDLIKAAEVSKVFFLFITMTVHALNPIFILTGIALINYGFVFGSQVRNFSIYSFLFMYHGYKLQC